MDKLRGGNEWEGICAGLLGAIGFASIMGTITGFILCYFSAVCQNGIPFLRALTITGVCGTVWYLLIKFVNIYGDEYGEVK